MNQIGFNPSSVDSKKMTKIFSALYYFMKTRLASICLALASQWLYAAHPREVLASVLVLEAVGDGHDGMTAVGNVILNRHFSSGESIWRIIHKPKQFQGFLAVKHPVERAIQICTIIDWVDALNIAQQVLDGILPDNTGGATHFHNIRVMPEWVRNMKFTTRVYSHYFYRS
jgi:N-acetylmuramoyl-L-alanine amidase